jgi:hypothetical protein
MFGWGLIIILFLLLLVIILSQIVRTNDSPSRVLQFETYSQFQPQTGDLLFVTSHGIREIFSRLFIASMWTHPAFILRDENSKIWVLEGANYPKTNGKTRAYHGFFFMPFEDWHRIHRKQIVAYIRHLGPPVNNRTVIAFQQQQYGITVDPFSLAWARFLIKRPYIEDAPNGHYTCHELLIRLLQHCGIVEKLYHCSSYMPHEIYHRQMPYINGHSYDTPFELRIRDKDD